LTRAAGRFYLAINLHNYDQQYERALDIISPLLDKYPSNPLFLLAQGDLYAKLGRKDQARTCYNRAIAGSMSDPDCRDHIAQLARASLEALGPPDSVHSGGI
jgi:Flp pilus assembly protein TadD